MQTTARRIATTTPPSAARPSHLSARWIARAAAATVVFASSAGVFASSAIALQAQATPAYSAPARPAMDLRASLADSMKSPFNFISTADTASTSDASSSSVNSDPAADSVAVERLSLSDATQPPPRRRYGRPRYNDNSHNADGSKKLTFEFGGGFTLPTPSTSDYSKLNYKFQVGVGRNFSQKFGVLAQFDWDNFGIQTNTLNTLLPIYQSLCGSNCTGNPIAQVGGNTHIWSFSINPIYNIMQSEKTGVYAVAGVGFYHKATNITTPSVGTYCDYYYGCYQYPANASIDKYTSNAPGFNGGLGFTYRGSRFSGIKFFAEARYVYILNSARPYYDGTTGTQLSPTYFNVFPQNSAKTSYVPVTFGIRF